jgi:hypothetical protein
MPANVSHEQEARGATNDRRLEVRVMPTASLREAPYNPRRRLAPTDRAYKKLTASLCEFGLVEPLVWNELSGYLVGGHTRLAILRDLGVAEVPVSVVQLSPEREKALNVILNNREAQGRFDPERLADILEELGTLPELELTGFDLRDISSLRLGPPRDTGPPGSEGRRIEITLVTDEATYAALAPRLDALVGEFDLTSHVRHW